MPSSKPKDFGRLFGPPTVHDRSPLSGFRIAIGERQHEPDRVVRRDAVHVGEARLAGHFETTWKNRNIQCITVYGTEALPGCHVNWLLQHNGYPPHPDYAT